MSINPDRPIEAVTVEGKVLPARIISTNVIDVGGRLRWIGLILEGGLEFPFRMQPGEPIAFTVVDRRLLEIRNRVNEGDES